jgi:AhpD family alkylhydroperoxidase
MPRITVPDRDEAPDQSKLILDAIAKQLGFVPNLHRLMSLSPAALAGWVGPRSQLTKALDARTRDGIALAVSEANGCDYCLAAHSYVAQNFAKMSPDEIA